MESSQWGTGAKLAVHMRCAHRNSKLNDDYY